MRAIIFHLILSPLIRTNYWLRERGWAADKWFWADVLALKWGYSVKFRQAVAKSKIVIQPHDASDNGDDGPYRCRSCGASIAEACDGRKCSEAYQRELAVWAETVQVAANAAREAAAMG